MGLQNKDKQICIIQNINPMGVLAHFQLLYHLIYLKQLSLEFLWGKQKHSSKTHARFKKVPNQTTQQPTKLLHLLV